MNPIDEKKLFTVGYGGRSPSDFIALLTRHEVRVIADVRAKPQRASMGSYVKAKSPEKGIEKLLRGAGIEYHWAQELGNPFLPESQYLDWRERYADLLAHEGEQRTASLLQIHRPFCLLCAEKAVTSCHRLQIAEYLASRGWVVQHLL